MTFSLQVCLQIFFLWSQALMNLNESINNILHLHHSLCCHYYYELTSIHFGDSPLALVCCSSLPYCCCVHLTVWCEGPPDSDRGRAANPGQQDNRHTRG